MTGANDREKLSTAGPCQGATPMLFAVFGYIRLGWGRFSAFNGVRCSGTPAKSSSRVL